MKKCVLGVLCACLFSVVLINCKKTERSAPAVALADSLPDNPLNPYDSFGYWHNVILDSLDAQRSRRHCQDPVSYCAYVGSFCKSKGWPRHSPDHHKGIPQRIIDFTTDPDGFIDRLTWSDSVKARLHGLFTRIASEGASNCSYVQFKAAVTDFEQEVNQSALPAIDKEVLLKAASTARFSAYRWSRQPELSKPYQQAELLSYFRTHDIPVSIPLMSKKEPGLFKRVARWIGVMSVDVATGIYLLSVADGAEISGYMRLTIDLMEQY